jgi:hypothetical protein
VTAHAVVFGRVQRIQKVEQTLNEFKRTRLVSGRMGGHTEWEIRWVESEWDCDQPVHPELCMRCSLLTV